MRSRALPVALPVALLLALPLALSAADYDYDLGIANTDITFSKGTLVAGDHVRVYARVTNDGTKDDAGYVTFYQGDQLVGDSQVITVRTAGSYDDAWVDFTVPAGSFNIRAEIKGTDPQDQNPANDLAISQFFTPLPDTDGDGIPDGQDDCPNAANPDQSDTDGDHLGDVCDPYPNDPTNTPPSANTNVNAPTNTNANANVNVNANAPTPAPKTTTAPTTDTDAKNDTATNPDGTVEGSTDAAATGGAASGTTGVLPAIDASTFLSSGPASAAFRVKRLAWDTFSFVLPPDASGEGRTALWDFGDGTSAAGESVKHAYRKPGDYAVTATVTARGGAVTTGRATVSISFFNFGNWRLLLSLAGMAFISVVGIAIARRKGEEREDDAS